MALGLITRLWLFLVVLGERLLYCCASCVSFEAIMQRESLAVLAPAALLGERHESAEEPVSTLLVLVWNGSLHASWKVGLMVVHAVEVLVSYPVVAER